MAHSSTTNEWTTGLLPHVPTSVTSGCGPPVIRWLAFLCTDAVNPAKVSKMVNSSVALLRSRRDAW